MSLWPVAESEITESAGHAADLVRFKEPPGATGLGDAESVHWAGTEPHVTTRSPAPVPGPIEEYVHEFPVAPESVMVAAWDAAVLSIPSANTLNDADNALNI
jgi:hypothetical protein